MTIDKLKKELILSVREAVKKAFEEEPQHEADLIFPPQVSLGDFALPCFELGREFDQKPSEVARRVASNFQSDIASAQSAGPYVNIKVKNEILFESVISEIEKKKDRFGDTEKEKGKKIMVEYLSPNTNKPLHLGHIRNGSLGMAMSNILASQGAQVIRANLINDRGVHICKSMLAYTKWGAGETPSSVGMKGDHLVGKWYVRYAQEEEKNPELKKEVQEMLQKWEENDPNVRALWKKMNDWAYAGFSETYQNLGFKFDKFYYESENYLRGKEVVSEGMKKDIFQKDEKGTVVFNLPENEFGRDKEGNLKKVALQREDGTSMYVTQDIGTTIKKFEENDLGQSIWVVGNEQDYYFKTLFAVLTALGYSWASRCHHLSYAMVYLPEGKMKSREGNVVDADNFLKEVEELAADGIKKRNSEGISEEELRERSAKIARGAIKFYLLRVRAKQDIHFNPAESIALEGFTGVYCQYAYARIQGILRRAQGGQFGSEKPDFSRLGEEEELNLVQKLIAFPVETKKAAEEYEPIRIAVQVYETAKAFNQFYNQHQVLENKDLKLAVARLALVRSTAQVLQKGLSILGIEVMEAM